MTCEEVHARYQQVLARQRVHHLYTKALQWEAAVTAQSGRLSAARPVEALHVQRDIIVGLRRRGLTTVGQVAALRDAELLRVRNVGPDTVAAIRHDRAGRYHEEP